MNKKIHAVITEEEKQVEVQFSDPGTFVVDNFTLDPEPVLYETTSGSYEIVSSSTESTNIVLSYLFGDRLEPRSAELTDYYNTNKLDVKKYITGSFVKELIGLDYTVM